MTEDYLNRFGGIARLYGLPALEKFHNSHVMIIGLGGVGSWAVEALARSGVGTFTLIDLDDLCLTNTNRQIHATSQTIGKGKAATLAQRIHTINPEATCHVEQRFYTEASSVELLTNEPDLVLDAIDSVRQKCHLLATCREQNIPVIASGGAGGRFDASQIQIADLSQTHGDALLNSVRKGLRSDYRFPKVANDKKKKPPKFKIPAVFSPEQPKFPTCDGTTSTTRPAEMSGGIKCDSGFGAVTHITATFGNLMAGWALDQLAAK